MGRSKDVVSLTEQIEQALDAEYRRGLREGHDRAVEMENRRREMHARPTCAAISPEGARCDKSTGHFGAHVSLVPRAHWFDSRCESTAPNGRARCIKPVGHTGAHVIGRTYWHDTDTETTVTVDIGVESTAALQEAIAKEQRTLSLLNKEIQEKKELARLSKEMQEKMAPLHKKILKFFGVGS